jgi:peptidoglycan/LPS O-acetylase OafA/YrhL
LKRFDEIEGLRGWLAWAVVLCHLAYISNVYALGAGIYLRGLGNPAVLTFVIISGFVITHLLLEKPEPYPTYLTRRFFRIFPVFIVTCIAGYFTNDLQVAVLSHVSYDASQTQHSLQAIAASNHQHFWGHLVAHLAMLHGIISNNWLPSSQYALNSPAWSLSLEWQFYLIAPPLIGAIKNVRLLPWLILAAMAGEALYAFGLFGSFEQRSLLFGSAGYFALGIGSRFLLQSEKIKLPRPEYVALIAILVALISSEEALPLLIWLFIFSIVGTERTSTTSTPFYAVSGALLKSRAALYFGSRSYSIYLCHLPLIAVCHYAFAAIFPNASSLNTFLGLGAMVIPSTVISADLLYRTIERRGMILGARLLGRGNSS